MQEGADIQEAVSEVAASEGPEGSEDLEAAVSEGAVPAEAGRLFLPQISDYVAAVQCRYIENKAPGISWRGKGKRTD